jgi:hypothetical protein
MLGGHTQDGGDPVHACVFSHFGSAGAPPLALPPDPGLPPELGAPPEPGAPPEFGAPPVPGAPPELGAPPVAGLPPEPDMPPLAGAPPEPGAPPVAGLPPEPGAPPLPVPAPPVPLRPPVPAPHAPFTQTAGAVHWVLAVHVLLQVSVAASQRPGAQSIAAGVTHIPAPSHVAGAARIDADAQLAALHCVPAVQRAHCPPAH